MKSNQAGYIPGLREYRMIFCKADYVESGEALGNPDCGWYRIYPFVFKEVSGAVFPALDFRLLARSLEENSGERLALVQFHIGFFRDRELSVVILRHMEQILACFRTSGKQIILRVAYDLEGKGLLHEPESEDLIHRHMEQLGLLIRTYASDILTLQGIFVGNWGGDARLQIFVRTRSGTAGTVLVSRLRRKLLSGGENARTMAQRNSSSCGRTGAGGEINSIQ